MKNKIPFDILADAALVFCCAIAAVCAVPTAYGVPFSLGNLIVVILPFAFLVCLALHKADKTWSVCLVSFLIILIYGFLWRERIVYGAKQLRYSVLSLLSLDFSFLSVPAEPSGVWDTAHSVTKLLIFSAAIVTFISALLAVKCRSRVPAMLVPIPAFIPALIYTDCAPALYTFAFLLIYWGGLLLGRFRYQQDENAAGRVRAVFILMLIGLALLLPLISPSGRFRPIPFSERQSVFNLIGSARDKMLSRNSFNPEQYDLSSEGDRLLDEEKAFSVSCSATGALLLRTHSYGLYGDSIWGQAKEFGGEWDSMLALGKTQGGKLERLSIRDSYTNERLTPYSFQSRYDVDPGESFIRTGGKTAYTWVYIPVEEFVRTSGSREEDSYLIFAKEQYTLPESPEKKKLLGILVELIGPERFNELRFEDTYSAARQIAEIVRNSGEYSLTPGSTPEGEDFIEYFLLQNRKGYCVHYASAAAALMQAMGIPARYVLGYRIEVEEPDVWFNAAKSNAHAWAEVYVAGAGWLPLECTAGFPTDTDLSQHFNVVPPAQPSETPAPDATEAANVRYTPVPPKKTHDPQLPSERPSYGPLATRRPQDDSPQDKAPGMDLRVLLAIPALLIVWEAAGVVIRKRRERSFADTDAKTGILAMLRYLDSLTRYGADQISEAEALANEAAFSDHDMEGKRAELLTLVHDTKNSLCRSNPFKRFILRWLWFRI